MPANENGEVATVHIQDELAIVTLVLVDSDALCAKELEDATHVAHGNVCDHIDVLVGKFLASLVALSKRGIGIGDCLVTRWIVRHFYLH